MKILDNLRIYDEDWASERQMRCDQLYLALGLNPKRHLPNEGLAGQFVGNVFVWVDSRKPGTNQDAKRVWCGCPYCHKVLTAGKLQQHLKVHRK